MLRRFILFASTLFALALLLTPAMTRAERLVDVSEVLQIRVLPGWREAGGRHIAGFEITLRPGWHTYWRSAGSLGISPSFKWIGSRNVQQVTPIWPRPTAFFEPKGQSYGYDRNFVLPLVIETRNPGDGIFLAGQIDVGVCAEICVPARVSFGTELPVRGALDPGIQAALEDRPARISINARCRISPSGKGFRISSELPLAPLGGREAVIFELPGTNAWITDSVVSREGNTLRAQSDLMGVAGSIERSALRITVLGERRAVEITGCGG